MSENVHPGVPLGSPAAVDPELNFTPMSSRWFSPPLQAGPRGPVLLSEGGWSLQPCVFSLVFVFDLSTEEGSSLEEIGFNWGEYLEEMGASAAPHTSFKHVRSTPSLSALHLEGGRRVCRKMPNLVGRKGMRRKGKFSQDFLKIKRWGNSFAFHR